MTWSRERALDECQDMLDEPDEMDFTAFDLRCPSCGALYLVHPKFCRMCGETDLEPVDDLAI